MEDSVTLVLLLISAFLQSIWTLPLEGLKKEHCSASGIAIYKVTFQTFWSSDKFSKQYPTYRPHAQWSKLVGRTHHSDYVLWRAGELASNGLREMAQDGTSDDLDQESQGHNGVFDTFSSPRIEKGFGQTTTNIFVDNKHHMVSLVSHLVPSPDWFVGMDSVSLCEDNQWVSKRYVDMNIWDAGTDKGYTFTSPNWPEVPSKVIEQITASQPNHAASSFYYPDLSELPVIAKVTFSRESITEKGELQRDWTALKGELVSNSTIRTNPAQDRRMNSGKAQGSATPVWVPHGERVNAVPETQPAAPHSGPVGKKEAKSTSEYAASASTPGGQKRKKPKLTKEQRRLRKLERLNRRNKKLRERKNKKSKSKKKSSLVSKRPRDVDCQISEWQEWSVCSKSCGYGTHKRMRTILVNSSGRGINCPPLTEDEICGSMRGCGWSHFNSNNWGSMGK